MSASKPFLGLTIAVTSREDGRVEAEDSSSVVDAASTTQGQTSLASELSYSQLECTVKILGGKTSKMVHKRTAFVVATENAIRLNSQRVRKAKKCNVDIVTPKYITACQEAKTLLPRDEYKVT